MPRDGATTLTDLIPPRASVVLKCMRCPRLGVYNLAGLIRKHGDARLLELVTTIANCERAKAGDYHNRCIIRWSPGGSASDGDPEES